MDGNINLNKDNIKKLFLFQIHKDLTNLCKRQLIMLEDLANDHDVMIDKLKPFVENEILEQSDYLTDNKFQHERKRILDSINETIRGIEKMVDNFNINIK